MRKIAGYLTNSRSEKDKKSPKARTKTDTSSQEELFGEIQNSFLVSINTEYTIKMPCRNAGDCITHETTTDDCKSSPAAWGLPESSWGISGAAARHGKV